LRILFISRHYPPHVSGGSRRAYELVKGLRARGEDVTVISPYVGDDAHTLSVFHPQPEAPTRTSKASWKDKLRVHLLYPDPDILWSLRVVKQAAHHYPEGFDYIITSSPPESIHVAGYLLKRAWGCYWLADFRDSWLEIPLNPIRHKRWRKWIEKRIARLILSKTDILTTTLQIYAKEAEKLSGRQAHILPNFADSPEFVDTNYSFSPDYINIIHTGSFSLSDPNRFILPLLEVFERAKSVNNDLFLHLIGRLTDAEKEQVDKLPFRNHIKVVGILPYAETRFLQNQAHALLVTAAPNAIAVPGKIEEYKSTQKPIIPIGYGSWTDGLDTSDPVKQLSSLTHEKKRMSYEVTSSETVIAKLQTLLNKSQN